MAWILKWYLNNQTIVIWELLIMSIYCKYFQFMNVQTHIYTQNLIAFFLISELASIFWHYCLWAVKFVYHNVTISSNWKWYVRSGVTLVTSCCYAWTSDTTITSSSLSAPVSTSCTRSVLLPSASKQVTNHSFNLSV